MRMSVSLSAREVQSTAQYISTFLDLVDNLPNEITRHLTQLHHLHNSYLKLINRMDTNVNHYNQLVEALTLTDPNAKTKSNKSSVVDESVEVFVEKKRRLSRKIEIQLIQMQELSDEKLKYSQLIIDLIETKAKELDLDYEEILGLSGKMGCNGSTGSTSSQCNTSVQNNSCNNSNQQKVSQHSVNMASIEAKERDREREANEENGISRLNDKRLLPRRACALKSGQTVESKDAIDETNTNGTNAVKVTQNKAMNSKSKSKTYSKCHNFGLSMSNFYRDMARRRAKLPKVSKMAKIGIKVKDKKSIPEMKRNAKKCKSNPKPNRNRKSSKHLIFAKQTNGSNGLNGSNSEFHKKTSKSSTRRSSSSSSSSLSAEIEGPKGPTISNGNRIEKREKSSYELNAKNLSSKRNSNIWSNVSNKKSKSNLNSNNSSSVEDLFIGEPIDPNEPTYCLCSQVSYGEMICCDNQMCPIEWFHFPCVQLVHKPKGKWFCPNCRKGDRHSVPKRLIHTN